MTRSNIILREELSDVLRATWTAHNGLAGALPIEGVKIYQAGFRDALRAVGLAWGVEWEDGQANRKRITTP